MHDGLTDAEQRVFLQSVAPLLGIENQIAGITSATEIAERFQLINAQPQDLYYHAIQEGNIFEKGTFRRDRLPAA